LKEKGLYDQIMIGKTVPMHEIYKHVLDNDSRFKKMLLSIFKDQTKGISWNDFYSFIQAGTPHDSRWSADQRAEMDGFYQDTAIELNDYKWTLKSGTKLDIDSMDLESGLPYVVGKVMQLIALRQPFEVDITKINEVKRYLEIEGWDDTKLYVIQKR
jgi:hypothetical protein